MELLEKLAALASLPRVHLVRYGGCLAPHSHLRGAIIPTLCQQGVDKKATDTGSLCWRWARRLQRVFALWGNNIMSTRENIPLSAADKIAIKPCTHGASSALEHYQRTEPWVPCYLRPGSRKMPV